MARNGFLAAALLPALFASACALQRPLFIIPPVAPVEESFGGWVDSLESWKIAESRNGPGEEGVPEWVFRFYEGRLAEIEAEPRFAGRYVFVATNQGADLAALERWERNFCAGRDIVASVVHRTELRFARSADLYPQDKFGDYFAQVIRGISNGDFSGVAREESFWVRREMAGAEGPEAFSSRFEYLLLLSIEIEALQDTIGDILGEARARIPATREQALAMAELRETFFEGF